jgi:hypothetical protein
LIHVPREIEDDGDVAALSGERCAAAAAKKRSVELAAQGDGGDHVVIVAGKNDADRDLAVIGAVGGIEGAAGGVEADIALKVGAEFFGESGGICECTICLS